MIRKILFGIINTISFTCLFYVQPAVAGPDTTYGNASIYKAFAKAEAGEDVIIGVIGGSITQGYAASSENKRWANLVADWWESTFSSVNITLINAGIGGTGSDIGTHRLKDDLLVYSPDFIVVEFAVNDSEGEHAKKMMEGIVRQVRSDTSHPGLMILCLKQENGTTAQESHRPVAEHYDIPLVSFADSIDNRIAQDGVTLNDLFIDGLHPVDLGMEYIAEFINERLQQFYDEYSELSSLPAIPDSLPEPLVTDVYAHTFQHTPGNLVPVSNTGWLSDKSYWEGKTSGDEAVFSVDGNAISILYSRHNDPDWGSVEVWIDDGEHKTLDAYWNQDWGPAQVFALIEEGLADGEHELHIKVKEEEATYFRLLKIYKAGNIGSSAPISIVGEQKKIVIDTEIILDGSNSYDPDGDEITSYNWRIVSAPALSTSAITNASSDTASFIPDVGGTYVIGLIVSDGDRNSVEAVQVINVVENNTKPVAIAGADFKVATGKYAMLNGSDSYDADNDSLSYAWGIISKPNDSHTSLLLAETSTPMFRADAEGEYIVSLVVNDSIVNSETDSILITAIDDYTSGISDVNFQDTFKVYPNPTSGVLNISLVIKEGSVIDIELYTISGELITSVVNRYIIKGEFLQRIDLNSILPNTGSYLLQLKINNIVAGQQIITKY